jgi:hypothetical protein
MEKYLNPLRLGLWFSKRRPARLSQEHGVLHLPMAVALSLIFFFGIATWQLLADWRQLAHTQLRLDRCVGLSTQQLRSAINVLEKSNQRIRQLRASIGVLRATQFAPPAAVAAASAIRALQAYIQLLALKQDAALRLWKVKRVEWMALRGCDLDWKDIPTALPDLDYYRPPADFLAKSPLEWRGGPMPQEFEVKSKHIFLSLTRPRQSIASVKGGLDLNPQAQIVDRLTGGWSDHGNWKAYWGAKSTTGPLASAPSRVPPPGGRTSAH